MSLYMDQTALSLKLVESFINEDFSFITKWIDALLNGMKITLPVSTQEHGHPPLWQYLDKARRFPDRGKLIDKILDLLNGQKLFVDSDFICQTCLEAGF